MHHPEYNVQLGTYYLRMLADSLAEKEELPEALRPIFIWASYNAGLRATANWMNKLDEIPYEELVFEHLGYRETRRYVQRIWAGKQIYQRYWSF